MLALNAPVKVALMQAMLSEMMNLSEYFGRKAIFKVVFKRKKPAA
jgi:hypothetical protein